MSAEFVGELMMRFAPLVDDDTLRELEKAVCITISEYDINRKCTDLALIERVVPECYEHYMVTKNIEGMSDSTLELYHRYIPDLFYALRKPIEEISANDIRAYLYSVQKERGVSNRTLNSRRAALGSFFAWVAAEGYVSKNPMITVKPIKYEVKERRPLKPIELEKVRSSCEDIREKAVIEVLYSTACRVSELCGLNKSDVDFSTMEVKLFGKGSKHRTSYLSPKAALFLGEYLASRDDESEALFVTEKRPYNRIGKRSIERMVNSIGLRAGIEKLVPHQLRHTSATDLLARGMDVVQLKELLGHASLDTSMIYAKVSNTDVKNSHQRYIS